MPSNPPPSTDVLDQLATRLTPWADDLPNINSPYNPDRFRNNCFFVTLAVLLGTNARELCNYLGMHATGGGVELVTASQALASLGLRFHFWVYNEVTGGGPIRRRDGVQGIPESSVVATGLPRIVGAAYRRQDGSGHIVVCMSPGSPYRRYMDYQNRAGGQDVTREVRNARICMLFAVDRAHSTGSAYLHRQLTAIEQMEVDEERETHRREEEARRAEQDSGFRGGRFQDEL